MKNHRLKKMNIKKQQGVVLIVSLIMLLVITGLGVSAVNITRNKTQVAGNSMYSMLVYHGAESTLARSVSIGSEKHLINSILSNSVKYDIPEADLLDTNEVINDRTVMSSNSSITPIPGIYTCPPVSNDITSSTFKCRIIEVTAQTSIPGTGAKAKHTEARAKKIKF